MALTINDKSITLPNNQELDSASEGAWANFGIYFQNHLNVAISTTYYNGKGIPITDVFGAKNIYVSPTSDTRVGGNGYSPFYRDLSAEHQESSDKVGTWKHKYTGVYYLTMQYRQDGGGDIWTMYSVQNKASNVIGMTARMGAYNAGRKHFDMLYYVYDPDDTCSLHGWCQSNTRSIGTVSIPMNPTGFEQNSAYGMGNAYCHRSYGSGTGQAMLGNSQYTNSGSGATNAVGRMLDIAIHRVGDLP